MKVSIVGNGIAAMLLAEKLQTEGVEISVLGKGQPQAPPQVMVHLYAGRSFRRSEIEVKAFEEAVRYWRASPFATETKVKRLTNPRLEKSLPLADSHPWPSPTKSNDMLSYGPAFVIDTKGLMTDIRTSVDYREVRVNERSVESDSDFVIWATGSGSSNSNCVLNPGVSIALKNTNAAPQILIGSGVHFASSSGMISIGGAFTQTKDNLKQALLEKAMTIISEEKIKRFQENEIFVGKKLVSRDRLPIVGFDENQRFQFNAFGARAFFWLPSCCKLAYNILMDDRTHSPFSPQRFQS